MSWGIEALETRVLFQAALPLVTVSAPSKAASENGAIRAFFVSRTGDLSDSLTVNLATGGTATNGVDYGIVGARVVLSPGMASMRLAIRPVDDALREGRETVTVSALAGDGYTVAAGSPDSIFIRDNDGGDTRSVLSWKTVAPSPIWRCEAARAVASGKLYVFGGFIEGMYGSVTRADVYDPKANRWTQLADVPTRLTHAASAVDGNKIYLFGGYVGWGVLGQQDYGTTDVWVYDIEHDSYSRGPSLPAARGAGVAVTLGRQVHFMGGCDPDRVDHVDHWVLDLDHPEQGWSASVPLPAARNHVGAGVIDGHIFLIGGQVGPDDTTGAKNTMYVWHPAWSAWKKLPDLPAALSHHNESTVVQGERIITLGGIPLGGGSVNKVSSYDPRTGRWTDLTPLPARRFAGVAAVIDDAIYFSGGATATTYRGVFAG